MLSHRILLFSFLSATVFADCCPSLSKTNLCHDATFATPNCGIGKCNIFGCNCDGGCRQDDGTFCTTVLDTAYNCAQAGEEADYSCFSFIDAAVFYCLQYTTAEKAAVIQAAQGQEGGGALG